MSFVKYHLESHIFNRNYNQTPCEITQSRKSQTNSPNVTFFQVSGGFVSNFGSTVSITGSTRKPHPAAPQGSAIVAVFFAELLGAAENDIRRRQRRRPRPREDYFDLLCRLPLVWCSSCLCDELSWRLPCSLLSGWCRVCYEQDAVSNS